MSNALNPETPFLSASQLIEASSALDVIHSRTIKAIDALQKRVDVVKQAVASRWKNVGNINVSLQRQAEAEEVRVGVLEIRRSAEAELDALFKEAGAVHARTESQRDFYASPVMTLNRMSLGDARRTQYSEQLRGAGQAELAHLGQWAVSTGNHALAAAIVARVDAMPSGQRPFLGVALAEAMRIEEHRKAVEAIKIADARFQGVVIAIRTWKQGKANPVNTVSLALQGRTLDEDLLRELERDNAGAR